MNEIKNILLVDDSDAAINLMNRLLSREGLTVITAKNGEQAILRAATAQLDLIVLDLTMPVLDGWEVCRYLKARTSEKFLPIIVLSGNEERAHVEQAAAYGADDYVFKPVRIDELLESVKRLGKLKSLFNADPIDDAAIEAALASHLQLIADRGNGHFSRCVVERLIQMRGETAGLVELRKALGN